MQGIEQRCRTLASSHICLRTRPASSSLASRVFRSVGPSITRCVSAARMVSRSPRLSSLYSCACRLRTQPSPACSVSCGEPGAEWSIGSRHIPTTGWEM